MAEVLTTNGGLIDHRVDDLVRLKYILDVRDFPDSPYKDCFVKDFANIESPSLRKPEPALLPRYPAR